MSVRIPPGSPVWVMPLGALPLGCDGKQLWYVTDDGAGACTPVGTTVGTLEEAG